MATDDDPPWTYGNFQTVHTDSVYAAAEVNFNTPGMVERFRNRLADALQDAIIKSDWLYPDGTLWEELLAVGCSIYFRDRAVPEMLRDKRPEEDGREWDRIASLWHNSNEALFQAVFASLSGFISKLPRDAAGPFGIPVIQAVDGANLIYEMINPMRAPELQDIRVTTWLTQVYDANVGALSKPGELPKHPQRYDGPREKMAELYLRGTPFLSLAQSPVPYNPFTEAMRVGHHWCLGLTRQGKTTFLRHMLRHDLEEAAKGNCSLVVIDSKTLIGHMRTLKQFAPGGPLDGRLILIDSDHPFPLNPFKIANKAEAKALLMYMLGNFMEMAGRQPGALAQYLNGVLHSRDKSLHTLLKYVRMDDNTLPKEIGNFPEKTQEWFRTTRKGLHVATESGIEQRLDEFLDSFEHSPAMKHFSADSWGLDLYNELHRGGKVLLVDSDRQKNGKAGVSMMGRLIIALVDKLANDRMKDPGPPVWVYVDEAALYLRKDETFVDIYTTAAEAKVGMTVAYQYPGQIENPAVEKALANASIHSECVSKGTVNLKINKVPSTLQVKRFEFTEAPQMEPEEIRALDAQLAKRYPYAPSKPAPTAQSTGFDPANIAE